MEYNYHKLGQDYILGTGNICLPGFQNYYDLEIVMCLQLAIYNTRIYVYPMTILSLHIGWLDSK